MKPVIINGVPAKWRNWASSLDVTMKHIEIIDGALNSRFEIYAVPEQIFDVLFNKEKDEIYLEELPQELQEDAAFWDQVYALEVDRRTVKGIHGILHTHPKAELATLERSADSGRMESP